MNITSYSYTLVSQNLGCTHVWFDYNLFMAKTGSTLANAFPELAKEWHPTKNGGLTAFDVSPGSGRKVWWQCAVASDHVWDATISNRSSGKGCPYCNNRRPSKDINLEALYPDVAAEWHPTKNGELGPRDFRPKSHKRVWWQCRKNQDHVWDATIANRTNRLAGCPFCQSATSVPELRVYTELKALFPETETRRKISGIECDIHLPQLSIAIEVDGRYWHESQHEKDLEKNQALNDLGVFVIRFREDGLPPLSKLDINYRYPSFEIRDIKRLFRSLKKVRTLDSSHKPSLDGYLSRQNYINDQEFFALLDRLPGPMPGKSLLAINLALSSEWHPEKNGTLRPQNVLATVWRKTSNPPSTLTRTHK